MIATATGRGSWHTLQDSTALSRLGSTATTGLAGVDVEARRARYGPNAIREAPRRHWSWMLLDQFRDFMILVLLAAAALAGLTGDLEDVIVILAIVIMNAVIGFVQEYRAEAAIEALRSMAAPMASVRRDGRVLTVAAAELVPGDIVLLEAGRIVPADLRLIEAAALSVQEAVLTGESQAVEKQTTALDDAELTVADRSNMAWKGTTVATGRGTGLVIATGMETELGRIARLLGTAEAGRTPLQLRLAVFGKRLSLAVIAICTLLFAAGLLRGEPLMLMLLTAVSLAVAAIPEALPAVVTIALAIGARRMVRRNALVRRLPAVETLGSVTAICSDKTGTLTQNRMQVRVWYVDGRIHELPPREREGTWRRLAEALAVSNDVEEGADGLVGDPTEVALHEAAAMIGDTKAVAMQRLRRVAELPFDPARQCMATMHAEDSGDHVVFVKGSPEAVLARCVPESVDAGKVLAAAARMASSGQRVIALAMREQAARQTSSTEMAQGLVFLGLVGLEDAPRPEAFDAVATCQAAGIRAVMITGDHPATARSIARELGMLPEDGRVIVGRELETMGAEELEQALAGPVAFARVTPEHKVRIVEAFRRRGEFVAMTGDGVNDAPALKLADIGIAMGRSGTDVAREAADMVLLDDNFATIVTAVSEGRRMYDNVRKFVRFAMAGNAAEILTILLAPFLGLPLPLLPIHILWVNLVTDGLPGLALAVEPPERGVMQRPPRRPDESLFAGGIWQHLLWVGSLIAGLALLGQAWSLGGGSEGWQTLVFTTLVLAQLFHVLAIRSERESLATQGLSSNLALTLVVVASILVQLAIIYTPFGHRWFNTVALSGAELLACFAIAFTVFFAVEAEKALVRRGLLYRAGER